MNRKILMPVLWLFLASITAVAGESWTPDVLKVIPYPNRVEPMAGTFSVSAEPRIYISPDICGADLLRSLVAESMHKVSNTEKSKKKADISLVLTDRSGLSSEAYVLKVSGDGICIEAASETGIFYGVQTLLQVAVQYGWDNIPCMRIEDVPNFRHRGVLIDVARHFFPKEFIMKQLDLMAYYKINRFHWHLVDGTGWRIEIRRYPQLTEKSGWRTHESLEEWEGNGLKFCPSDRPGAYGGYYTQEDIKEVVAYAAERHITVIPEIEMPGHNEEVMSTFPELACDHHIDRPNDLCIGNPETSVFLKNVLTEIFSLFPSEYIHIGGDEAAKNTWGKCSRCRQLMEREGIEDLDGLQSYFIHDIEEFLNSHGKKLIGWDEIMQGGLAPGAVVMSWRGPQYGIEAARMGHDAIMTPIQYCYFNFYQDNPYAHFLSYSGYIPLEKVYSYNPACGDLTPEEKEHILGIQGNLWTEYIPTERQVETMLWPRVLAIAETGWTVPERKSYSRFRANVSVAVEDMYNKGYSPFDIENESGERKEYADTVRHIARGKTVRYIGRYTDEYPGGGDSALTDGLQGGWDCGERWQGYIGGDMDVVIDLEETCTVKDIHANFIQDRFGWFWLPKEVEIHASLDGTVYTLLGKYTNGLSYIRPGFFVRAFGWQGSTEARYIRYIARPDKTNPKTGFIFTDEIIVR